MEPPSRSQELTGAASELGSLGGHMHGLWPCNALAIITLFNIYLQSDDSAFPMNPFILVPLTLTTSPILMKSPV